MLTAAFANLFSAPKACLPFKPQSSATSGSSQTQPQQMGGSPMHGTQVQNLASASPNKDEHRMQLPQHDLLLFSLVAEDKSLGRPATDALNPRVATSHDELGAHFETERFKLIVVECAPDRGELVQSAIEVHRRIPPEDSSSLIAFKPGPDRVLDLLRYTPSASAFAFLAAKPHQLRAHILELLTP